MATTHMASVPRENPMKSKKFELNVSTLRKLGDQDSKKVNGATEQRMTTICSRPPRC